MAALPKAARRCSGSGSASWWRPCSLSSEPVRLWLNQRPARRNRRLLTKIKDLSEPDRRSNSARCITINPGISRADHGRYSVTFPCGVQCVELRRLAPPCAIPPNGTGGLANVDPGSAGGSSGMGSINTDKRGGGGWRPDRRCLRESRARRPRWSKSPWTSSWCSTTRAACTTSCKRSKTHQHQRSPISWKRGGVDYRVILIFSTPQDRARRVRRVEHVDLRHDPRSAG